MTKSKAVKEDDTLVGIPTMALLPPKNFYFKVDEVKHKITVPRRGAYTDLDSEFFSKDDGNFSIAEEDCVINLSIVTKVLFGTSKYPALLDNQLFCPISIILNTDTVDIVGQVVDMLEAPTGMTVDDK